VVIALGAVLSKEYVLLDARAANVRAQVDLMWHGGSGTPLAFVQSVYVDVAVKYFVAYILCLRTFAEL
jgi:hypothetical protein